MKRRVVFLDRDGTIVEEGHYLADPAALRIYPYTPSALRQLAAAGFALVVVSNQSGVARGYFDEAAVAAVNERLVSRLAEEQVVLDGIYYCPHHPAGSVREYARVCDCRKPATGMLRRAAAELELDLEGAWMLGDKPEDMALADAARLRGILLRSGQGEAAERKGAGKTACAVCDNLAEAARVILGTERGS